MNPCTMMRLPNADSTDVVNAIAAYYLFGESVTPMRLTGIAVIILGVWIVARS